MSLNGKAIRGAALSPEDIIAKGKAQENAKTQVQQQTEASLEGTLTSGAPALSNEEIQSYQQGVQTQPFDAGKQAGILTLKEKRAREFAASEAGREAASQEKYAPKNEIDELALEKLGEDKYKLMKDKEAVKAELKNKGLSEGMQNSPMVLPGGVILPGKGVTDNLPWYNPAKWVAGVKNTIADFLPDTWGMTKEEESKYREVNSELYRIQKPVAIERDKQEKARISELEAKLAAAEKALFVPAESDEESKKRSLDFRHLQVAIDFRKRANKKTEDFLNGSGGWDGLMNNKMDLLTAGASSLGDLVRVYNISRKSPEELSETDKEVLSAYGSFQKDAIQNDNYWYNTMNGLSHSLVFMEGMILTGGVGSSAREGVGNLGTRVLKKSIESGLEQGLKRSLLKGGIKTLATVADISAQAAISPMTFNTALDYKIGQVEVTTDKDGKERILLGDELYKHIMTENKELKAQLTEEYTKLQGKDQLSPEEQKLSENIEKQLDQLAALEEQYRPKSAMEAGWKGFTDTAKEIGTEIVVGPLVDKYASKLVSPITKRINSRFGESLVFQQAKRLKSVYDKGAAAINATRFGAKAARFYENARLGQIVSSPFGEFAEEITAQIIPSYGEDYAAQLRELRNPSFYGDVAVQTMIMSAGFTGFGLGQNAIQRLKNPDAFRTRKDALDLYRSITSATTDDAVADQILMNSATEGYTMQEYDAQIRDLKSQGELEKANKLEKKKFFNLAVQAMRTNTISEFETALDKVTKNDKLSAETRSAAALAATDIATLKKTYNNYRGHKNFNQILDLASQQISNKNSIAELEAKMTMESPGVEAAIKAHSPGVDFSMSTLFTRQFDDQAEQEKYDNFLNSLATSNSPEVQNFISSSLALDTLKHGDVLTKQAFNEAIMPSERTQNRDKFLEAVQQRFDDVERLNQNYATNNMEDNGIGFSDTTIDEIIDSVHAKFDGKVDKATVAKIKGQYKALLQKEDASNIMADVAAINEEIQTMQAEAGVVAEQEPVQDFVEAESDNLLDVQTPPDVDFSDVGEQAQNITNAINSFGIENNYTEAEQDNPFEEDDFSMLPATPNLSEEQEKQLAKEFKALYDGIERATNKKPSFEDTIGYLLNFVDKADVEKQYNIYKKAWQLNNLPEADYDALYNSIFDPTKEVRESFLNFAKNLVEPPKVTPTTEADLTESSKRQEKEIEESTATVTVFTEENIPVKTIGGRLLNTAENTLAYNSIRYIEIEDENGRWSRQSAMDGRLNLTEDSLVDFRDLLNPDMYNEGDSLSATVVPENMWGKVSIVVGRGADAKPIIRTFADIMQDAEAEDPNFRNTDAFANIVPMFTFGRNGKPLSFIHDSNWYNIYNVADPSNPKGDIDPKNISKLHWDLINEAKANNLRLRKHILAKGTATLTITEKKEGAFYSVAEKFDAQGNRLPLMTISEANPDSIIAIQKNQGDLEIKDGVSFNNNKRKIINQKEILDNRVNGQPTPGHTWHLRRIGIDPTDGKETWRAFKVIRYVNEEQLETVRWAWSAYAQMDTVETMQDGKLTQVIQDVYKKNVVGGPYEMTKEQATKMIEDIKKATGYNLLKFKDANAFFNMYFQTRNAGNQRGKNATYGNEIYNTSLVAANLSQQTTLEGLTRNAPVVTISGTTVTAGKPYQEYLKDNLQTDVKSFNVGTEDKPVYATSVQPVITFTYDAAELEQVVAPPTEQLTRRNELIQEVIAEQKLDLNTEEVISEFDALKRELGFNFGDDFSYAPNPVTSTEALRNIFNLTPGLSIAQEQHIVDFIYNFVSSSIDVKYKSKVNKNQLFKDLENSYDQIVGPVRGQVQQFIDRLSGVTATPEITKALGEANQILTVLDNIKNNWTKEQVQANLGEAYNGELGILDKAMEAVYNTSDIKETHEDEEQAELEEDVTQRNHSFEDNAALTESGKQKTSYRLRRFMAGIPEITKDSTIKKGFLGLPAYVGFNTVYDGVAQMLTGGVYIQADYNLMKAKLLTMEKAYPWVNALVDKLDKADEQIRKEFVTKYRQHVVDMEFAMTETYQNNTTSKVYKTNANETNRVILDGWKNNLKTTSLIEVINGEYVVNKTRATELLEQYKGWDLDRSKVDRDEVRFWMENFGIKFSDGYWNELVNEGFRYGKKNIAFDLLFSESNTPIGLLKAYLEHITSQTDTRLDISEKNHPLGDMGGVSKALAGGESRYTAKTLSKSFRDAGKNISGLTNPTFVTNRIDDLRRSALDEDDTLIQDLQEISLSQDSLILNLLTNEPEFASKFKFKHLGITAFKEYGKKGSNFASITDLNSLDHDGTKLVFFQDMQQGRIKTKVNGFSMRLGSMFLPTMSDKTQMGVLSTGVFNLMEDNVDAFTILADGSLKLKEDLRELLYNQLVLPELKRIMSYHERGRQTNISDYDMAAQIFNFIPELNNVKDDKGRRMIKWLGTGNGLTIDLVETKFKDQMMDVVENLVHNLAAEKLSIWEPFLTKDDKGTVIGVKFFDSTYMSKGSGTIADKFKIGTYDFVINSLIANADAFKVIAGDPALFSKDKLFKGVPVPFDAKDDNFYSSMSMALGTNLGKRMALLIAPGATLADSYNQAYMQLFLDDVTDISANAEYLIGLYYGKKAANEAKKLLEQYDSTTNEVNRKSIRTQLSEKFPKIKDYFDIESTDAQEYTTVKEHLYIMRGLGRLSAEQEEVIKEKLANKEDLTKEELNLVMQPIKPVHTGQVLDKAQDVLRTVYIKSSSFPLLPQLTAGTKLDALREKMEELEEANNVPVRASYYTANKVGALTERINPFNEESLKNAERATLMLNRNDFRIQQDVPFKSDTRKKEEVSMGTQIFKLLLGNGMMQEEGFMVDGAVMNGQELYDYYNESFTQLLDIKKQTLFKELGLDKNGNATNEKEAIEKLQQLLQKEAIKRGYPIQDINGLGIDELTNNGRTYYEFKVPLWLSTNSNRYESLLNSIVSNRLMKHKMPGSAFVVGSETGFGFSEDMVNLDKSRIIYMDNYNGKELQGVHTTEADGNVVFHKAQVFVPSKFKDNSGKLIDLFAKNDEGYIYLEKRGNGTWRLKDGMIDPALFNNFSFRTPTSAHKSGSSIEIAGFLPPEAGDLMIVPKNFTKQKGLDYDIDKETAYALNHVVDYKTGKIEVFSEKHRDRSLKTLKKIVEALDADKTDILAEDIDEPIIEKNGGLLISVENALARYFNQEEIDLINDKMISAMDKIDDISARENTKLLENNFVKAHLAIFNNPSPVVQGKINAVLSMDFAREQADMIETLTRDAQVDAKVKALEAQGLSPAQAAAQASASRNTFSILSDEYQKKKMALGSAGKLAIGIYSTYVTFHALTQQTPAPLRLTEQEIVENPKTGKTYKVTKNKSITIGNITSDGILGRINTLGPKGIEGDRTIAEAFEERQNTATDNEKEQILGRVNINSTTIGVDSLLTLLGFDKDDYGNSISYMLLSQPIIKEYVERLAAGKGITADFQKGLEERVIKDLIDKYSKGEYSLSTDGVIDSEGNTLDIDDQLNGQALTSGILSNGEDGLIQIAALSKFVELNEYAKNLQKVQSVVNTNNLGKSIIESNAVFESLKKFADNPLVANVASIIGEFSKIEESNGRPEGAEVVGEYYVVPKTPQGQIVVQGLVTGQKLWSKYFPYGNVFFDEVMNEVLLATNTDLDNIYKVIEAKQQVVQEIKKYLYSGVNNGIFNERASEERKRLFIDAPGHQSLATYLNNNITNDILKENKLLQKLTYEIETNGLPSLIKFNNTTSGNFDEKYLYNAISEMILEDRTLPDWNGEPMTTKRLAQELVTYSYIEGGVQEAIQFIKYVPIEYLMSVGYTSDTGKFTPANQRFQLMNSNRNTEIFKTLLGIQASGVDMNMGWHRPSTFTDQYMQHHPEKAKQYTKDERKKLFANRTLDGFILMTDENVPMYISERTTTKSKLKKDKFVLYKHVGGYEFKRMSVLGVKGMNEYEYNNANAVTIVDTEAIAPATSNPTGSSMGVQSGPQSIITEGQTVVSTLQTIINHPNSKVYARYQALAEVLLPFADATTTVAVKDTRAEFGTEVGGMYGSLSNAIILDSKVVNNELQAISTFMHEYIHSITKREVAKYYNIFDASKPNVLAGTILSPNAPAHVAALHRVWLEVRKNLDPALLASATEKTIAMKKNLPASFTSEERDIAYAGVDIFEFMSVAMESRAFQKTFSEIPYAATDKSLWEKFVEVVQSILRKINPDLKAGSLAEAAMVEILNFTAEEKEMSKNGLENAIFAEADNLDFSEEERNIALSQDADFSEPDAENPSGDFSIEDEGEPDFQAQPSLRLPEIKNCN